MQKSLLLISLIKQQFFNSRITTQLGYKHTFCQNVVPTTNCFLYFHKNVTCLSLGLLMICNVSSVSHKTVLVDYGKFLIHE